MTRETIDAGGRRRTYLHLRPNAARPDAPLLLALHGTSQQGRTMRAFSGRTLDELAQRIGSELVYLDGVGRAWNDARLIATSKAQKQNVDDVAFVTAVVDRFARPAIAVGYSNGGQLLHRILREKPGLLAGATLIAAGLPIDEEFSLVAAAPDRIPTLLLHGTADPIVPYEGGATRMLGRTRGTVQSATATAESYAPASEPVVTRDGGLQRTDWGIVRQVTQFGVGHVVPNRRTSPARLVIGRSHHDLDTGEEMEEFFGLSVLRDPTVESESPSNGGHA